jgi:hypothetical protein
MQLGSAAEKAAAVILGVWRYSCPGMPVLDRAKQGMSTSRQASSPEQQSAVVQGHPAQRAAAHGCNPWLDIYMQCYNSIACTGAPLLPGVMYLAPACFAWLTLGSVLVEWRHMASSGALAVPREAPALFLLAAFMGFAVNVLAYATIKLASSLTLKVLGEQTRPVTRPVTRPPASHLNRGPPRIVFSKLVLKAALQAPDTRIFASIPSLMRSSLWCSISHLRCCFAPRLPVPRHCEECAAHPGGNGALLRGSHSHSRPRLRAECGSVWRIQLAEDAADRRRRKMMTAVHAAQPHCCCVLAGLYPNRQTAHR